MAATQPFQITGQPGAASFNLPIAGQAGQAQGAVPSLTNIFVGQAAPTTTQRALTSEAISRHVASAMKTPGVFWQIARPNRTLKLSGAINYVNKNYPLNLPPLIPGTTTPNPRAGQVRDINERFVYWPDFLVAGTVSDIANAFRQAVGNNNVTYRNPLDPNAPAVAGPVSEQAIYAASLDPLNPQHRAAIEQLTASGAVGGQKRAARHSLAEYIAIGEAIRASTKGATTTAAVAGGRAAGGAAGGAGTGRGGRSPQATLERLVAAFNQSMQQVLAGIPIQKVLNVGSFDPVKFTGVRAAAIPSKTGRSIHPVITVNGRQVAVPIIAQPTSAANFQAFVQNVVGRSQYAQLTPLILQAFQAQAQQRAAPVAVSQFPFTAAAGGAPAGLASLLQSAAQQGVGVTLPPAGQPVMPLPQAGGVGGLPSVAQPPATINIMEQLAGRGAGSPRSGAASPAGATVSAAPAGGFQLPVTGAPGVGTTLPVSGAAGVQLPGGLPLPSVGGGLPSASPAGAGGLNLPSVQGQGQGQFGGLPSLLGGQGGASAFPAVNLPSVLGGSPGAQ